MDPKEIKAESKSAKSKKRHLLDAHAFVLVLLVPHLSSTYWLGYPRLLNKYHM